MTLNGQNVTLAEINKLYGARHKNFNEDRSMLSAAKCRLTCMILVPKILSTCEYSRAFHWRAGVKYNNKVQNLNMNFAGVRRGVFYKALVAASC